ncbi:TcpE family conjugal transfer membrane protein [Spirillospora sp. CA-142024]|uniref:TcpE family conjugal transfer membrane protein n=1 Tax=Spirillospora sp. CA-142024 TaxID=3240036 RepID=UPI003D911182
MDLPTYTNIWRIEKRLYKLYDLRLPMPLPLVQIGVFLGVFVPWILLLRVVGIPFESPWHVLYIVPPGVLTWLATRPVIEGKRLTELLLSQSRYLAEPRTWCRLTPIREPREVVIVARVWRRTGAPAPAAAMERAAIKSRRRVRRPEAEPVPVATPALVPRPSAAAAPPSLGEYAAQREPALAPLPGAPAEPAPPRPWRRGTRDISHEDDVLPASAELDRPPATPLLEAPPPPPGSGKRALASGVRRPGAPAEFWQAAEPPGAGVRRAAEEIANAPDHDPRPGERPAPAPPSADTREDVRPPAANVRWVRPAEPGEGVTREPPAEPEQAHAADGERVRAVQAFNGEPGDRKVAGQRAPAPLGDQGSQEPPQDVRPAMAPGGQEPGDREPQQDVPPAQKPGDAGPPDTAGDIPSAVRPPAQLGNAGTPGTPGDTSVVRQAGQKPGEAGTPDTAEDIPAAKHPGAQKPGDAGTPVDVPSVVRPAGQKPGDAEISDTPGGIPAGQEPGQREGQDAPPAERPAAARHSGSQEAERDVPPAERPAGQGAEGPRAGEPRRDLPRSWTPAPRPPATRPDIPMVPGAFGTQGEPPAEPSEQQAPRLEPPRPWTKGLSNPPRPAASDNLTWPPVPEPGPPPAPEAPAEPPPPAEEAAPPREVRSQPASPVRPRPLPPPPAPPPSGPAITPPGPEHEVSGGGLRRLIHAVGGGHGEVDADYQQRIQQPFHGTRHVVVLGCTGGAGQTVTSLMLGHTFAQYNGEPVVAIDVNPGPGALARRTRSDTNETLTGLITRADQVGSLTAMRRYTSQAKSGLDVIAAGKNPLQALDDRDYALAIRTIDKFYSVTLLDAAAAVVARVLPYADQIVLVAPASADAPRAVAMTFEWLDGHGYEELRSRAVTVINGVSRRSMDDVEQAEAVARGRCRALVRIPWDDHLSMDRAPRNELKSLRTPTRRAYLALAGVVAGGFTVMPERYQELQQEQEATR